MTEEEQKEWSRRGDLLIKRALQIEELELKLQMSERRLADERKKMMNIISEDLENGIIVVDENKLNELQDKLKSKEGLP